LTVSLRQIAKFFHQKSQFSANIKVAFYSKYAEYQKIRRTTPIAVDPLWRGSAARFEQRWFGVGTARSKSGGD